MHVALPLVCCSCLGEGVSSCVFSWLSLVSCVAPTFTGSTSVPLRASVIEAYSLLSLLSLSCGFSCVGTRSRQGLGRCQSSWRVSRKCTSARFVGLGSTSFLQSWNPKNDAKREAAPTGAAAKPAGEANVLARRIALSDDAVAPVSFLVGGFPSLPPPLRPGAALPLRLLDSRVSSGASRRVQMSLITPSCPRLRFALLPHAMVSVSISGVFAQIGWPFFFCVAELW